MRPRSLNFEQLVDMNRQELLNDEKSISQIEEKLEKKQEAFLLNHKKNNKELTAE
ncbi:FbpB family small basic protein [Oceanobacillus jeddahense]|uniref:FbpB family small basic protein n=1 Tax=Oceanobacillus jeddahense TaxID=1462527 RepID=A0ABY5JRK9_9BACI|nr:FbpB family small basic protein [Oceanobacillus jeddahense]UUI01691.1 FbpB family small basic protein [Oceanobacillus jeddahense]